MSWQSKAVWPRGTMGGGDISTDTHATKDAAEAVCRMLEREGFGGGGKIFPLHTSVCELSTARPARPSTGNVFRDAMAKNRGIDTNS